MAKAGQGWSALARAGPGQALLKIQGLPATTAVLAAPRERHILPIEFNVRHPTVRARNMSRGFNAGVFVMNVSRMAELNLIDEMIELARAQAPSSPPARAHRSWPHPSAYKGAYHVAVVLF